MHIYIYIYINNIYICKKIIWIHIIHIYNNIYDNIIYIYNKGLENNSSY